jgi:hypothetical protein
MKNQLQQKLSIQKSMVASLNTLIMNKKIRGTTDNTGDLTSSNVCLTGFI